VEHPCFNNQIETLSARFGKPVSLFCAFRLSRRRRKSLYVNRLEGISGAYGGPGRLALKIERKFF
jgi:hypothetical protein